MASDTPTPLTDKARLTIEERQRFAAGTGVLYELVNANFARRLERRVAALEAGLREIVGVASGETGLADAVDDTDGLAWVDKKARALLKEKHDG